LAFEAGAWRLPWRQYRKGGGKRQLGLRV
jgi:hypothetical protein